MKKIVVLCAIGILAGGILSAQLDSSARALKVVEALERAEARRSGAPTASPRPLEFSEEDLNAFVAYDLLAAGEEYVREVSLKLLDKNRVEGKIVVAIADGKGKGSLPSRLELFFAAGFETEGGRIRIDMDSLYMGTEKLPVAFIDTVIAVVSRLQGVEPTSLSDWYLLPFGIQRLETRPGKVLVYHWVP
jgi:hypothetical protein